MIYRTLSEKMLPIFKVELIEMSEKKTTACQMTLGTNDFGCVLSKKNKKAALLSLKRKNKIKSKLLRVGPNLKPKFWSTKNMVDKLFQRLPVALDKYCSEDGSSTRRA